MYREKYLQEILGTDKRNPVFTVFRNQKTDCLHVYYGFELFEIIPNNKNDPQYKLTVARLYNAGINAVKLKEAFGTDRKTMSNWGDALKSEDPERLIRVLAGRQAGRKLTTEIRAFVGMRFPSIYKENTYSYSKQIREEIEEVFDCKLCSETIRPLIHELKKQLNENEIKTEKRETNGDSSDNQETVYEEDTEEIEVVTSELSDAKISGNRKGSPLSETGTAGEIHFIRYLGILLFNQELLKVTELMESHSWILKQWLATLFLGAVNIEQTKLLDFNSLGWLLDRTLRSLRPQRLKLGELACPDVIEKLYVMNADLVNIQDYSDFFFDPHTKHSMTQLKILKGWCGNQHFPGKALHMDFIHTCVGDPVYIGYADNFYDLRERFIDTVNRFRTLLHIDSSRVLTFILDRGIYGKDMFEEIILEKFLHVITWEKNYKQGSWDENEVKGSFSMEVCRNKLEDTKKYDFRYMDETWDKNASMRLIRVQATNHKGRTIEVGVLSDDSKRPAEECLRLIFRRWLQENDFKYLEKHFGINQATSYASITYKELEGQIEDKQMKSGEYKALEKERGALRAKLKSALLSEHKHPRKSSARLSKIDTLSLQEQQITQKMEETEKEVSRLKHLIENDFYRLDVSSKKLMDVLKLIARNSFYKALKPFKEKYNNYRDDHAIFRNLTRADGIAISHEEHVEVYLYPTTHYPPKLRNIIEELFQQINANEPRMLDGTRRKIIINLGEKTGIKLAN